MKILSTYVLKEAAIFFAITLFAFTGILLTLRMLHFASLIINKGVEATQIAEVFVSIIPTFLEIAIPMSTLLGVMLAFARLSGDSEIVVMRASGISLYQLVTPVFLFGVFVAGLSLVVSLSLKPWGFRNLSRVLFEIARSKSTSGLTEGVFNSLGSLTLYAEKINDQNGALSHVLIDDRRDKVNRRVIFAKTGTITSDAVAQTITLQLFDGESHEIVDQRYVITHFADNSLTLQSAELLEQSTQDKDKSPREMSLDELRAAIITTEQNIRNRHTTVQTKTEETRSDASPLPSSSAENTKPDKRLANELRKRYHRLRTELGSRFSMPFASFILALIALPLGIVPPRAQKTWGAGLTLSIGLAVFVGYYGLLSVGLSLSERNRLGHIFALWIPNLACALVTLLLLQRMASEKWLSVADALHEAMLHVRRSLGRWFLRRKQA